MVAASRGRRVRTVPVVVPRRRKLPRPLFLQSGIAAPGVVEAPRANQLLIAVRLFELLALLTLAVPPLQIVVTQLAGFRAVAIRAGAIGEALAFRPDPRVEDADDDVFPGVVDAELRPQSIRRGQAEERRRVRRVHRLKRVLDDVHHAGLTLHGLRLIGREFHGEAVVCVPVVVDLPAAADAAQ
jgi:hypothetical protein